MTLYNLLRNPKGRSDIRVQLFAIGSKVLNYSFFHSERPRDVAANRTRESDLNQAGPASPSKLDRPGRAIDARWHLFVRDKLLGYRRMHAQVSCVDLCS